MSGDEEPCRPPTAPAEGSRPSPRESNRGRADPMSVGGAQVIKTAEERPREANGLQEVSNVVGGELRTSRPVTCAARQVSDPQHHRERRQSEPGGVPRAFPSGQRGGENER